ncbi:hypothetical protein BD626DRAFT_505622 [Schizophyllum amplum]|uniref:Uncharacterized protein n=1 Tax=Schizophyllum amplum TaxID=97359 RepID=A0A550C5R9_9AGAR|nr:hypothetical protein BD626DRAFT_505622 [Auriculariopsis ampla]
MAAIYVQRFRLSNYIEIQAGISDQVSGVDSTASAQRSTSTLDIARGGSVRPALRRCMRQKCSSPPRGSNSQPSDVAWPFQTV